MNITNQLGQLTELWCQIDFCERGIVLSQPTNPSSRYDFIAEIDNKLYRIQCKTAHGEINNRISIMVKSKNWNKGEYHSYIGEIDYFYTHWKEKGYLIPIELCTETNRQKFLRLEKKSLTIKNNENILYGEDYELDVVLSSINKEILKNRITIENFNLDKKDKNLCKICKKPIWKNSLYCLDCYKKQKRIKNFPSREELKEMIRTLPFTKIGEKYGKTDNAIRKWCDYYSLPRKKSDIKNISDLDWINI